MKKIDKLFIGTEVEGSERGLLTLFIPKNAINRSSFLDSAKKHKITRLYFGAGNDRGISSDIFDLLETIPENYSSLLEIEDFNELENIPYSFLLRTNIIFVCKVINQKVAPKVFKIETKTDVHWYDLTEPIVTSITDELYTKDIRL